MSLARLVATDGGHNVHGPGCCDTAWLKPEATDAA